MSEQRKIIHDDNNGLDYVLVGDYYIPIVIRIRTGKQFILQM